MNDMNEKIMNLTDEQMEQVAGGTDNGGKKFGPEIAQLDLIMNTSAYWTPELLSAVFAFVSKACDCLEADNPDGAIASLDRATRVLDDKKFGIVGSYLKSALGAVVFHINRRKST